MDNTTNLSDSIIPQSNASLSSMDYTSSSSSSSTGLFGISLMTWILIILILAFLGFNVFVYLAQGTQTITDILEMLFGTTLAATGEVIDVSAEGAKKVVGGTANVLEKGLTAIQDITPNESKAEEQSLNASHQQDPDYQAHEASSSVSAGKSGWCFIGEDKGFRSCSQVGEKDTCMSGDIFPTQEICMNPNLRV
jgi:hypothetical protein